MDQDRARSLLIAEQDEVRSLLKGTEAAGQADRVAEVESEAERVQMVSLCGVEGGWVSDHLGVKAEFNILDRDDHEMK